MAQNNEENPYVPQPHIVHEKRTGHHSNMHRLIVDGVAGKWARAFDEFAVHESGYAASPWNCMVLPKVFQFKSMWSTEIDPKPITEYYTDSDIGFERGKPQ